MDAVKRREEITRENTFEQKEKKPGLEFNPGLALIGLGTTGPRSENGRENNIFWSEIGSGFGEPGGTTPPRIPRSAPSGIWVSVKCCLFIKN